MTKASEVLEPGTDGRRRVAIEGVAPEIDGGRFPIKRTVGESVEVEADVFADGHDQVAADLLVRPVGEKEWRRIPMEPAGNDRWRASFAPDAIGRWEYTIEGWIDPFGSWRRDLAKRVAAGTETDVDLRIGAELVRSTAQGAGKAARGLEAAARRLASAERAQAIDLALGAELEEAMARHAPRAFAMQYPGRLPLLVERERARYSTWYELFPRSAADEPGRHGTFDDVIERLPYVAGMGFDVLYLPPIHPIGKAHRKGPNNAPEAGADDVGSPWAIGGPEGGHDAIHPALGTLEDFRRLVAAAREQGIEIALDLALQCSPDHPWVKEHPQWFRHRPDGTIQYAENPPKKYQDIYPIDFETDDWRALWEAIRGVVEHWVAQGVKIFRVDNPHTKAFPMWEWLIRETQAEHPDLIFLSEAFTRPKVMYRLAKLGFTQSYNYFPWRRTAPELYAYFRELTTTEVAEYFRPNLWPNTPDILTEQLQVGGRPVFLQRLVLAATLGASYGIYGPAYELLESASRDPGGEEYLDSEKYQLRHWDLGRDDSIAPFVARVNRIRRDNPALQTDRTLAFHPGDNDRVLCYSKSAGENVVLVAVNTDPHHRQATWLDLDLEALGLEPDRPFQAHELLSGTRFLWNGPRNYVELDPWTQPAMILRLRRRVRTERDFDYYL